MLASAGTRSFAAMIPVGTVRSLGLMMAMNRAYCTVIQMACGYEIVHRASDLLVAYASGISAETS